VLATLTPDGTYADPGTGGPIRGDALVGYMNGLFAAFPDVSFEVTSIGMAGPDLVAAQWIMRGTNAGPMNNLPPTGRSVELHGADFIRVRDGRIRSVDGYFDSRVLPEQLGLQVVVQPNAIGPFAFGISTRTWVGSMARPGAISITALQTQNRADEQAIREHSREIATEMLGMKGFIGWLGATVGNRMMTITAWETPQDPEQLTMGGQHSVAMQKFFGSELGAGGYTSVYVPRRINSMWMRCSTCGKMMDHAARTGVCTCGAALPDHMAYW